MFITKNNPGYKAELILGGNDAPITKHMKIQCACYYASLVNTWKGTSCYPEHLLPMHPLDDGHGPLEMSERAL